MRKFVRNSVRFDAKFSCNLTVLLNCRITAVNLKVVLDANTYLWFDSQIRYNSCCFQFVSIHASHYRALR